MAPTPIQQKLIDDLQNKGVLNKRFDNLKCVNGHDDLRRGVLSLVFQAQDLINDKLVAVKFMDPELLSNKYRIAAFEREPEILETLEGKKRCLQIVSGMSQHKWEIDRDNDGNPMHIKCGYFATEWIEEDVDDFFYRQSEFTAREKLLIFRNIILCIEAIHRENIFHRDIKINNLRLKISGVESIVVAIDYGTAAEITSPNIMSDYTKPVGANVFSGPEAFVGFAGDREYGHLTDIYAIGTLLFELFNTRQFHYERELKTNFKQVTVAIATELVPLNNVEDKLKKWCKRRAYFKYKNVAPLIDGLDNSIPPSIMNLVSDLYKCLIEYDFTRRLSDLSVARAKVDSMIAVLDNDELSKKRVLQKRQKKIKRKEKIEKRERRLLEYLEWRQSLNASK